MLMAAKGNFGNEIAQVMVQPGPFRESWMLLGSMEKLLYFYIKDPRFVHDLARIATDFILEITDMAAELGADVGQVGAGNQAYLVEAGALLSQEGNSFLIEGILHRGDPLLDQPVKGVAQDGKDLEFALS